MKLLNVMIVCLLFSVALAGGAVSDVKARQRYPWNGKIDIDCTLTGEAGRSYSLMVNARDKVGCTNLTVQTVSVEGEPATGNPVSVTSGVYRLVWDAGADLPNGYRCEKLSISVCVVDNAKKFMIVDLSSGAITYQATAPEGGWNVDEYKGTKMAFVRIEPGTFTQYSIEGMPGREVTISKPYYIGILPVTHRQLRTLCGGNYNIGWSTGDGSQKWYGYTFNDTCDTFLLGFSSSEGKDSRGTMSYYNPNTLLAYRGGSICAVDKSKIWPFGGSTVANESPLGVLRQRTGIATLELPTEAQLSFSRSSVIWDGYCLSLDTWTSWLGNASVVDPQGPEALDVVAGGYYSACVSDVGRTLSVDMYTGARFCINVAE